MSKAKVINPLSNNICEDNPVPAAISNANKGSFDLIFNNSIHLSANYYYIYYTWGFLSYNSVIYSL